MPSNAKTENPIASGHREKLTATKPSLVKPLSLSTWIDAYVMIDNNVSKSRISPVMKTGANFSIFLTHTSGVVTIKQMGRNHHLFTITPPVHVESLGAGAVTQ